MSLYPSLEDMKVDHMAKAQAHVAQQQQQQQHAIAAQPGAQAQAMPMPSGGLYPSLNDFMGLQLTQESIRSHMPETGQQVVQYQPASSSMVAPVTGQQNVGLMRSEIKQGIRPVVTCKDAKGKLGLRVQHINKGVFVSFVQRDSPAALAGLRFGDQILQINGTTIAGFDREKVMNLIKKSSPERIEIAVRDRPFERAITLQKDSAGHVGFVFKNGKITSIVKDSSAARNGLLIEHNLLEVHGQNVVGLKDKEISEILKSSDRTITITIMPSFIYEHMVKCMSDSLVKKKMDHSIPDL
ncbi:syntenin-1-like [Hydractinia symbiolongicarpus]|uniref:syntenin-1-like n=1 Tax=Hydractinia symbiolongicarpus TaxID=13093 RepID=UPI00254EE9A6|nr:syntenin-1-like [Hydractinia symbiolongicarpus]